MHAAFYVVPVLSATVYFLIRAEFRKQQRQVYFFKPISTLLVIAAALVSFGEPAHHTTFSIFVLLGLLFSLGGDVALMFQERKKAFLIGLVLFLCGHVAYTVVFSLYGVWTGWDVLTVVLLAAFGAAFFRLIKPNLGKLKLPVIFYMAIISAMVNRAAAAFVSPDFTREQAWMIAGGALLFYLSDVMLATNRFWKPWPYHRFSLALYYGGQLLIALSASYF